MYATKGHAEDHKETAAGIANWLKHNAADQQNALDYLRAVDRLRALRAGRSGPSAAARRGGPHRAVRPPGSFVVRRRPVCGSPSGGARRTCLKHWDHIAFATTVVEVPTATRGDQHVCDTEADR